MMPSRRRPDSFLTESDLYLFRQGTHYQAHDVFGAHVRAIDGVLGTSFTVWAPAAARVSVVGNFNGWDPAVHRLTRVEDSGIWETFVPGVASGTLYKYAIESRLSPGLSLRADPFARFAEEPPSTGSRVWQDDYRWGDEAWMRSRSSRTTLKAAQSIYEVHLGSWRRHPDGSHLSYREIAPLLAEWVVDMGFTHVELMPVMEHPYYASWGYQVTGFFAPTARYGTPSDFKFLVDTLHQAGLAVILDWVPSHFPEDPHALGRFDGSFLYEHADPRKGFHPDWKSLIFNYRRPGVRSFLISNALFWLEEFHADGLRVDAVASMIYLDYSRKEGEWEPNEFGGRENLDAISFLRALNSEVYRRVPDAQTYAEESTSWPLVSHPVYVGGLGFGLKWDMGWMHDTLEYIAKDPFFRRHHHQTLTFRAMYAGAENYLLPLSHDEVVHGKSSLLAKMPGDEWRKFANLRLLLAYQFAQTGQKLLFMGSELASWREWSHERELDWHLLQYDYHDGVRQLVRDLNHLYRIQAGLHRDDHSGGGFTWVEANDVEQSVICFLRGRAQEVLVVLNFTPIVRRDYRIGVPHSGRWREALNTDAETYGGSGVGNLGQVVAAAPGSHLRPYSLSLTLPPLGAVYLVWDPAD